MMGMWKSLLAEFMGTLSFVLIGCGTLAYETQSGTANNLATAIVFAFALIFSIYTWSNVSECVHLNPAFTIGQATAGKMNLIPAILYIIAQILGAIAAVLILLYFVGSESGLGQATGPLDYTDSFKAMVIEAVLTFFFVLTFSMCFANRQVGALAGIIVGLALGALMLFGLPYTGASLNMARQTATSIFVPNGFSTYWIYVVGGIIGALVAGLVTRVFMMDWTPCVEPGKTTITTTIDNAGDHVASFVRSTGNSIGSSMPPIGMMR